MPLLYHAYVYLEFLILACTIYILAPTVIMSVIANKRFQIHFLFFIQIPPLPYSIIFTILHNNYFNIKHIENTDIFQIYLFFCVIFMNNIVILYVFYCFMYNPDL